MTTVRVFKDGHPAVCAGCGKPLVLTREPLLWFETTHAGKLSWHPACRPSVRSRV